MRQSLSPGKSFRFDAVQIHSAPEALAEQIVARIRHGELNPGTCLPSQRELARAFEVGLGTVREAVKILNVMGYLEVVPGKGTFIAKSAPVQSRELSGFDRAMEAISLAELMTAREVIESGAARMAAERADPEDLERLRTAVQRMRADCASIESYYQNDFEFHLAVAEASNNPAIFEIVKLLVEGSHRHIGFMNDALGIAMPVNVEKCVNTARKVVHYIERGNPSKSEAAMKAHLNIVGFELKEAFLGES